MPYITEKRRHNRINCDVGDVLLFCQLNVEDLIHLA